jgi:DNA-binding NarL/FixJ family response regulator
MPVRIAIVEDHELFREGIVSLLEKNANFSIIGKFNNGKAFIESLDEAVPDIVLMDISMPEMDGITATQKSLQKYPELRILVLTMFDDYFHYQEMLSAGVKGFILKDSAVAELEIAIRAILDDKTYFSNRLLQNIIHRLSDGNDSESRKVTFSEREMKLLKLISQGFSNKQVAEKLFVSIKTVESNKSRLFEKANVKNSMELIAYAMKNKLINS